MATPPNSPHACPSCGNPLLATARFCGKCGQTVTPATAQGPANACGSCGAPLAAGAQFCPRCGAARQASAPAPAAVCPSCASPVSTNARFCRACGHAIVPGATPARAAASAGGAKSPLPWIIGGAAVLAAAAVGAFFLFSGGDDDGDAADRDGDARPRATTTRRTTPAGDDKNGGSGGSNDLPKAQAELADLTLGMADKTYKIVYDVKGSESESKTQVTGTVTIVSAPPRMAFRLDAGAGGLDLTGLGESGDGTPQEKVETIAFIFESKDSLYICMKPVGKAGECQHTKSDPSSTDTPEDPAQALQQAVDQGSADPNVKVEEIKGQKIAGRDARCFAVTRKETTPESDSDMKSTICVDKSEGLPLLMEGSGFNKGKITALGDLASDDSVETPELVRFDGSMKAKSFALKATESDFKPPYAVTEATQ